ncbi:hypothetical protein O9992_29495 [Vibrio lentus]|nr:hypothetical protein [Vibrio lentus]
MRTRPGVTVVAPETFTLTQSLAELEHGCDQCRAGKADVGGVVTVTAVFTKAVSKPTTATLGSNTVVWTSTGAALQTWVGKVAALTASDTRASVELNHPMDSVNWGTRVRQTKTRRVK